MDCTIETCPVSESIYGYRPSVAANSFFVALFASAAIVQTAQGIRYRTWTYCTAMVLGCVSEALGHAGRIMLHDDPFGDAGFNLQICLLTLAPAFLAAAIYLMLKHLVLATSPQLSRLPARWYTYIFITCDLISLVLQAAGGGTAATADGDMAQLDTGDHMMMAGLSFQVFTLLIFGGLSLEFGARCYRRRGTPVLREETAGVRAGARFRWLVAALATAYAAILVRCVYRIVEMAGGWRNPVMQNEASFIALDSTLCSLAVLCLTVWHPGHCFDYRSINRDELLKEKLQGRRKKNGDSGEKQPQAVKDVSVSDGSDAELGRA